MQFVKTVLLIGRRSIFIPRLATDSRLTCNSRWDTEGLLSIIMRRTDQHITKHVGSENEVDRR